MIARFDLGFAVFWMLLGVAICIESWHLGMFGAFGPDRGFFPFLAGVVMAVGGLMLVLSPGNRVPRDHVIWPETVMAVRVGSTILLLGLLVALMPWLGFLVAAALVTPLMVRFVGSASWLSSLMIGIGTPVIITFLFTTMLSTPLPRGVLRGFF